MSYSFTESSYLAVAADALWADIVSPPDINAEFRPLLKMTFPQGLNDVTAGWQPGVRQFRSWILLGALVPVEYDDLAFEEVVPGVYFLERSSMLLQSVWEHRRELQPSGAGTRLVDSVRFEPRLQFLGPAALELNRWIFRRRHRRLRQVYGLAGSHHEL